MEFSIKMRPSWVRVNPKFNESALKEEGRRAPRSLGDRKDPPPQHVEGAGPAHT